jgi:hypothetical protein
MTRNDYHAGVARLWLSGGVIPLRAERGVSPLYFWLFTVINWMVVVAILAVGLLMVIVP